MAYSGSFGELSVLPLLMGIGGLVGLSVTRESMLSLSSYILPIICLKVIMVGGYCLLALVLYRLTGWDMATCLIAAAPLLMGPEGCGPPGPPLMAGIRNHRSILRTDAS
ncbi:MAG: AbrB family transcriptional regulator [Spirochaetaceae bacterium]|nr:AbrB family transcriptional regulator [Spirochaetaceae bacterium]